MPNKLLESTQIRPTKDKVFLAFIWVIVSVLFINAGTSLYFYRFYQKPSIVYPDRPFQIVNKELKAGDQITFVVTRCAKQTYAAHVTREIVDTLVYSIAPNDIVIRKGCIEEHRSIPTVTRAIAPGIYYMRNVVEVKVSWLWFERVDRYDTQTEPFTIIGQITEEAATATR